MQNRQLGPIERLKKWLHETNIRALMNKEDELTDSQQGDLLRMSVWYKVLYGKEFNA